MSDTDSFIEEVTEEVRRDRLFGLFRRYGWIAVLAVLLVVGGAAYNEWRKAQVRAAAEATGDALFAAIRADEIADRIIALEGIEAGSPEAQVIVDMLTASHHVMNEDGEAAGASFDKVALSDADMPAIYTDIARFKALVARGSTMDPADRRLQLETLAQPGAPLSLLAQEQLALLDIEGGDSDAAIARLGAIVEDAAVTPGLLRRASQLIVALGGELPDMSGG